MKKLINLTLTLFLLSFTCSTFASDVHTTLNYSSSTETTFDLELTEADANPPRQKGSMTRKEKKKSYLWFKKDQEQQMQKAHAGYMKRKKGTWFQRLISRFIW